LQKTYLDKKFDMLVHINAFKNNLPDTNAIQVFSESSISGVASNYLTDRLNTVYQNKLMLDAGMNRKQIDSLNSVTLSFTPITADKNTGNADMNSAIGYFSGFLIYIVMFIYGMMVMRGVMEEKTNRIAEVIISSVKPFELMMGKVLGIALVGLTQFVLWIAFIGIIFMVSSTFFPGLMPHATMPISGVPGMEAMPQEMMKKVEVTNKIQEFMGMPWLLIGFSFLFYFIGGYLLYASLFAAVGSLVNEDAQDAQGLTFPITMPIIAGFLIAVQAAQDPNSSLAVFGSIFPLTSPIVMMSRIAYHPPAWQIALSMALLIATFIGTIWLSAKIYRTGILMYGKKVTWKEALKWVWK
jgi:ABC-2 type transport system permease protein